MKTLRNILGFALIVVIFAGLGYIGWFMSKETNLSWSSIMGTKTASTVHNQLTETSTSTDVNPLGVLQGEVTNSYKSIQLVAETMSAYPLAGSANIAANNANETSGDSNQIQHFQRGLYTLSEGIYLLNQLNQSLEEQARLTEASAPTYQVYANRHNLLVQDKAILSNVFQKISDAKELLLSNLSGTGVGVNITAQDVQQANKAVYQMAQSVMELDSTNLWVDSQIKQTMLQGQQIQQAQQEQPAAAAMNMENTTTNPSSGFSIGRISMPTLITMFTILFIVLMLIGVIGAIRSQIAITPQLVEEEQTV